MTRSRMAVLARKWQVALSEAERKKWILKAPAGMTGFNYFLLMDGK